MQYCDRGNTAQYKIMMMMILLFYLYMGLLVLVSLLHLLLMPGTVLSRFYSFISAAMQSIYLIFHLPLLHPCTSLHIHYFPQDKMCLIRFLGII